jgi:hypothetical protein
MKTPSSRLGKFLIIGALGIGIAALVALAANGSDGSNHIALVQPSLGDSAGGAVDTDFAETDALLSQGTSPSSGIAADKSIAGGSASLAKPPVAPAPDAASRNSAGPVTQGAAPDGTSSIIDDRKIVQTASMRLEVKEVGASFEDVGNIATGAGGFVASSSFSNQGPSQVASISIRVPSDRYQQVLADLRGLGTKVIAEDSRTSDVTAEYTDLDSRLRNVQATETQLLELLGRATTINEILLVQDRLNSARAEIEQIKGRMALLDKLTDLATITVHLQPVAIGAGSGDGGRLSEEVSEAWDNSIAFLTDAAAGAIHVVVFAWWLPIIAVPAFLIGRSWLRNRPLTNGAVD